MKNELLPTEEWKLGYAAGILDGEGSVQIVKSRAPTTTGYRYELLLAVSNIAPNLCCWLKDTFGGSFYQSGKTSVGNLVYHWQIEAVGAKNFLQQVYPYLIIKKDKATIALEFQNARTRKRKIRSYTQEEWDLQAQQKTLIELTK